MSLEFSIQRTRMVGAAFGQGQIDVWDVSAPDGTMTLLKQIASNDTLGPNTVRQDAPHPHQALLENSGRYFIVNDLGTDTILVIDSLDDAFEVVNHVRVPDAGCGPRHGAFFPATGADFPNAYLVVCEMLNLVEVFASNSPARRTTSPSPRSSPSAPLVSTSRPPMPRPPPLPRSSSPPTTSTSTLATATPATPLTVSHTSTSLADRALAVPTSLWSLSSPSRLVASSRV